ncbi:MAG: ribonuclease P protein component [Candidatus Omnitrophica bacterium]|nr:ribonuclease P protein component [Candidatus Omnitrophota bacterium]
MKLKAAGALSREQRLRRTADFRQLYLSGRRVNGPSLSIFFRPNQLQFSRLGISVTKKRVKLSTRRHFLQRRLREAFRRKKQCFLPGYDLVFSARRMLNFREIEAELLSLARKARLLQPAEPQDKR